MADFDPTQLTQFDLQNLPPEQAAALARAQQAALAQQQHHALLGMLSAMPELQKAGGAEYEQAAKERAGGQGTAANVFKTALGMKEAEARLQELKLQGAQLRELIQQHGYENDRADYEAYLRGRQTVPGGLVEREGKTAGELANIQHVAGAAAKVLGPLGGIARTAGEILGAGKEAELAATEKEKEKGGYKTEPPLTFDEFRAAKHGSGKPKKGKAPPPPPPSAGGDMVTVQIPGHPPGPIHRSQLSAFQAKYPGAVVLGQ